MNQWEKILQKEAETNDVALRRSIASGFDWKDEYISSIADTIVLNKHGKSNIISRLRDKEGEKLAEFLTTKAKSASPLCQYLGGAGTSDVDYWMISKFSENVIISHLSGVSIPHVDLISLDHLDENHIIFFAARHGFPAGHLQEVADCYKEYKAHKAIPDPNFKNITAHLFRGAEDWTELVYEPKKAVDVEAYLKLGRKLNLIVKDKEGHHYTIYLGEKEKRYNGLVQVRKALADEDGLEDALRKAIIKVILEMFAGDSDAFYTWSRKHKVPEEITKEIKQRLNVE